ncbi:IclR family transcriptional regulator domain-containing protein [Streptomyces showdoensis]|uniref:Glycerol operon regulatory protein n=1 Tax=Streptomyces showdoensis TaxID=68268 RepID=A0A2P2GUY8_STREW|nr:IclR family transcriptional regulator C-terminal domain-containing protein [Streptomyces showdoensis]KKZ75302.1 IclR family transcriptional regulator [Streptomyces showdoensis]
MPPTHDPTAAPPPEAVTPLLRGVDVLRRLTDAGGRMPVGELERAAGLARSTVDRITATLSRMGYVRAEGRDVVLAPRLLELGNAYLASVRLPDLLGGRADALADALDESVSLAVADGDGIRFIHQATRRRAMSVSFRIGDLLPAERTAPGALFASEWNESAWEGWRERRTVDPDALGFPAAPRPAGLPDAFDVRVAEARERGWALDDQLIEPGLVALSVPVRDHAGRIVCVLSTVSHTSRHDAASLPEALLPHLRDAAAEMERVLRDAPTAAPAAATGLASWTGASKQELGREFVESLARGLTVLTAFGEGRQALPLTAVAEATGLARATARRALITLEHLGCVAQDGRTFRLTPRVLSLGFPPLSRTTLTRVAQPHLADLASRVRESTSLAVLAGDEVQYTGRVETSRIMNVHITIGTRFPAYATSMGRVLLAGLAPEERAERLARTQPAPLTPYTVTGRAELGALLEEVGRQGYALVDEELEVGLRSIAMPVRDRAGSVVAAVNVALHSARRSREECVADVLPELAAAIRGIEADLHVTERFARVPAY